jgi:NitT/TauT family transport system permease protein
VFNGRDMRDGGTGPAGRTARTFGWWVTPREIGPADAVVLLAAVGLLATLAWLGHELWAPFAPGTPPALDLAPGRLPYYAARSLFRMFAALAAALVFSLVVASAAAKSPAAARLVLPALDILQSVPVLGFLSATVTLFIALVPGHVLGLELASIFAIFTSQVWNLTFAFYHVQRTLPREQAEALRLFRVSGWQRFTHFELPAGAIPLVWNGMMSFGGGWFFLAASEAISVLGHELVLPGIGSFMAVAARQADLAALAWAVVTMVVLILLVDALFWRPVVAWSEKFKVEETTAEGEATSAVLDLLRRSHLVAWLEARLAWLDERIDRAWRRAGPAPPAPSRLRAWATAAGRVTTWLTVLLLVGQGVRFVTAEVAPAEIARVAGLGALTLVRVAGVVVVAALVWTPVGVWIGMNPKVARVAQPVVQVLASFPANFLFPLFALLFLRLGLSLEWGGMLLMALGAQWYILFNTIAGAMAIPNDLREMTRNLGLRGAPWWGGLVLPAIFPAWVTGALTAAGGAWNASIVAEVVTWGDVTLRATGLGAYITEATARGDWPRIVLGVGVMSAYVVGLNRLLWRRLETLAVARFSVGA